MQGAVTSLAAALAATVWLWPQPSRAQPAEPPTNTSAETGTAAEEQAPSEDLDKPPAEVIEVQVIGEKADAMQKIPGSGTIIRPREIERTQPADAAEMLRRVPGVHVRQDSGAGGRLDIGLRGLDPGRSRRVLVLEDGVPIANNPYAEPDMYWAPPVERWRAIEVVKGSGNILFGPQTVGGVINFITPYAPFRREVRLEAKGGQRRTVQAFGRYGDAYGSARYLGQVLFSRGDGFRGQGFRTVDSLAKVNLDTSSKGQLTLTLGLHDNLADSDDVGLTTAMFEADPRRRSIAPHDQAKLRRYSASAIHEHRFDDVVTLRTLAYFSSLERAWRRQVYDRFPVDGTPYERIVGDVSIPEGAIYFRDDDRVLDRRYLVGGFEPRLELRFPTGSVSHTVSLGARVLGEGAHYQERDGDTPESYAGALQLDERRDSVGLAGYVQNRMAFAHELVLVTPGVRVEHFRYRRRIERLPNAGGAQDVDIEGKSHGTAVIPGVGMTIGTPDIHGFGGIHMGFAPPRVTSTIRANGATEELDEERSVIYELGARAGQRRLWQLELTGFLNNFSNQVVPSSTGATTELVNGGQTRHMGLESAATVGFGELMDVGLYLDVTGRYTLMRARFVGGPNDGNDLPYAPNHIVSAVLDLGHSIGLGAQLSYNYVDQQFADDLDTVQPDITGRTGAIDGYHRIDANVHYTHEPTGLTATLSVKDLLDRPFIISRRPEGIFASGFRQILFDLRWDYAGEPSNSPLEN